MLHAIPNYLKQHPHVLSLNLNDQELFEHCPNNDDLVTLISEVKHLQSLSLSQLGIGDATVALLARNTSLINLDISLNARIGDKSGVFPN